MSDATRARIAVLLHRRCQHEFRDAFSRILRISDGLAEPQREPLDPGVSLQLQKDLLAKFEEMRPRGVLQRRVFADKLSAVDAFVAQIAALGAGGVFQVYGPRSNSGFFAGPVSPGFVKACLRQWNEGFIVVLPGLESGVLLDVVLDDPL